MEKGKLIGRGRTAEVFIWGEKNILKLYRKGTPYIFIENEFRTSRIAFDKKIPTPYAVESINIEEREGIIYEFVKGITMMKYISLKPWVVNKEAQRFARLHYRIHENKVSGIANQKSILKERINAVEMLTADKKKTIIEYLELINSGDSLCHGDFHPDNIIVANHKEIVIDWMTGSIGNPVSDVARTYILLTIGALPENTTFIVKSIIKFVRNKFYLGYIKEYLKISGIKMEEIEKWILPVAAARLIEWLPQSEKDELLRIVDEQLQKNVHTEYTECQK